ncbi:hypothetical protein B566_EDAN009620 [Ephemera danica]|nr:hypothetical protein B566_EDAN009620 [Ephemera danica]
MSDKADLSQHVHVGDVLAACRGVRADVQAVLNVRVARTSASAQGFMALMLRVTATVHLHDSRTTEIKLVFKQLPLLKNQLENTKEGGMFEKERSQHLPLVKCYLAQGTTVVMEDLSESGYETLIKELRDFYRSEALILAHMNLVARRLAQFHVTSLGRDWLADLPQLEFDPIDARDLPALHADWLLGTNCIDTMAALARLSSDGLNVICHGDCHTNNMMFKHDTNGKPVDVKLHDMQLVRYTPPSRDLMLYLFYTSTSRSFRRQHEKEMSDEADLSQHVHVGDVLAACRGVRADVQAVLNVRVARTSDSVQGFTSLMLRVTATVRLHDSSTTEIKLVFKQVPLLENQREVVDSSGVFEKEITFYRDIVPLMKQRCQKLPLVECYLAQGKIMVMEDLGESGFEMVAKEFTDLALEGVVTLAHVRLVVRRLAQLHAASLGRDWLAELPEIKHDPMFMGKVSKMVYDMISNGCRSTSIAMRELLPHCTKHADWLLGTHSYDSMARLAQPSSDGLNVICHGDCHANNMMFKHDKEGKPVDVKLLDMQIIRYSPPSRDLLYFLYTSTSRKFRLNHEKEILQTYVDAFNAAACTTPDLMTFESLFSEYDKSRMFGLAIAMNMRPLITRQDVMPEPGQPLSSEKYESLILGDNSSDTSEQMRTNPLFRECMRDLVEELVPFLDKNGLV